MSGRLEYCNSQTSLDTALPSGGIHMDIIACGSRPSRRMSAPSFTGTVWQDPIIQAPDPARIRSAWVRFEPGARTAWHTHPLGQTLFITSGVGWVQIWGGPVKEIRAGDTVWIPPQEKHWHGATAEHAMEHIAMQEAHGGEHVTWLDLSLISNTRARPEANRECVPRNSRARLVLCSRDSGHEARAMSGGNKMIVARWSAPLAVCLAFFYAVPAQAQQTNMTFFVTSVGPGKGGDLGGLSGADQYCQQLAAAVGAGAKTWRAYLSTQGNGAVNARDRIGKGPWINAKGVSIAKDVAELHGANNMTKQTVLNEKGEVTNGRGDTPNRHDILTGSQPDGTAFAGSEDRTCRNYTSSTQGAVMVGHSDRLGLRDDDASRSWNSSHPSRGPDGGCSQADLRSTGGDGLFYCFAAN
jgi:quercetin dioxygenase-like cupin family protein